MKLGVRIAALAFQFSLGAGLVCLYAADGAADADTGGDAPPVLRDRGPVDTRVVRLPGAPPVVTAKASVPKKVEERRPVSPQTLPAVERAAPAKPPVATRPKSPYPDEFQRDSALYCQKRIGQWTERDARLLLGEPRTVRPALGEQKKEVVGRILAFRDPSGRHNQLELDFNSRDGKLRTVFVYPWDMYWEDCHKLWGSEVSSTRANSGRIFYSYLNRRVDVLVEPSGKVYNFGLY